jgi:hypothetical protein
MSHSEEHHIWKKMKFRCLNPNSDNYHHYGGRGIVVCDRWLESFENFYQDMGPRPKGLTLERKNNDGPYSPENCKWATRREQANNTRRTRRVIYNGQSFSVAQLARQFGLSDTVLHDRLFSIGWDLETALRKPLRRKRNSSPTPSVEPSL